MFTFCARLCFALSQGRVLRRDTGAWARWGETFVDYVNLLPFVKNSTLTEVLKLNLIESRATSGHRGSESHKIMLQAGVLLSKHDKRLSSSQGEPSGRVVAWRPGNRRKWFA